MKEITKAIRQLSGRATGVDGIPPDLWKDGGPALHSKLHEFLVCCWEQGKLPIYFCDAVIVTLYKNKGNKSNCSNYREITLLSVAGKILTYCYPPSLKTIYQNSMWVQSQQGHHRHGVRPQTAPKEMPGAEKRSVYSVCGPDQKVWHTEGLWMILERLGCPPPKVRQHDYLTT